MHDFSITILRTKESSRSFKTVNGKEACTTWKCVLRDGPQEYASFKTVNGKEACTTHFDFSYNDRFLNTIQNRKR